MSAHAGNYPGNNYYSPVKETTSKGNVKSSIIDGNMEWDYASGWHSTRKKGWKSGLRAAPKSGRATSPVRSKSTYHGFDGQEYTIYKYHGFDDAIGFHARGEDSPNFDEMMAFAERAFDQDRPDYEEVIDTEGCGHIKRLEYATASQILRVTFWNGSKCLYFKLPTSVAGELMYLAESGIKVPSPNGNSQRHALGIVFWSLVRIRGQVHGSKYPFEYETHADGKLVRHSEKHRVPITRSMLERVIEGENGGKRLQQLGITAENVNDVLLNVTLNDEEYARYEEELNNIDAESKDGNILRAVGAVKSNGETIGFGGKDFYSEDGTDALIDSIDGNTKEKTEHETSATNQFMYESAAKIEHAIEEIRATKAYFSAYEEAIKSGKKPIQADIAALREASGDDKYLLSAIDKRSGRIRVPDSERNKRRLAQAATGDKGALNKFYRKNFAAKGNARYMARTWTVDQLKDFANPTIQGNISRAHAEEYKAIIETGDWDRALDFLKNNKTRMDYVNPNTGAVISKGYIAYASPRDEIEY